MKRNIRGYKIADKYYKAAMKRANENGNKLAQMIEGYVFEYGSGALVPAYHPPKQKKSKK